jgi:hypothetical protein
MRNRAARHLGLLLAAALAIQASGCGLILYPERKGQGKGDLDPGVVVLDAIGLLFFIIPGVVAFIVDFHHETIYMPKKPKILSDAGLPEAPGRVWFVARREGRPSDATGAR